MARTKRGIGRARDSGEATRLDEKMMKLALGMARRGRGLVHPNPSVGAVVYRGEEVLGKGRTQPPGGPHAEVEAIAAASRAVGARGLEGASIAVTLEPCSFTGRTGPCTQAIIEAGLSRVVAGLRDPHARVSGRGFRQLRRRGIEIVRGVLESECAWHHRGFVSVCERGRPHLTLKLAATLDGRIATASGESRWITDTAARALVHRLRAQHDAVMVGSRTAIADDPELTVRRGGRVVRRPIRVLVDGGLRVPAAARLFEPAGDNRTWVLCREGVRGADAARERAEKLIPVPIPSQQATRSKGTSHLDLDWALRALAREGLTTVFVEGGGQLAAALLRADLVDEVHWMLAPKLLGSDGRPVLGPLGVGPLGDAVSVETIAVRRVGPDLHWHARIDRAKTKRPATDSE